jgi:hypothetical protein
MNAGHPRGSVLLEQVPTMLELSPKRLDQLVRQGDHAILAPFGISDNDGPPLEFFDP